MFCVLYECDWFSFSQYGTSAVCVSGADFTAATESTSVISPVAQSLPQVLVGFVKCPNKELWVSADFESSKKRKALFLLIFNSICADLFFFKMDMVDWKNLTLHFFSRFKLTLPCSLLQNARVLTEYLCRNFFRVYVLINSLMRKPYLLMLGTIETTFMQKETLRHQDKDMQVA